MPGDWSGDCTWHELGRRWFPVPAGGDLGRGPLVPALWLSCRDAGELLAERGITVDHGTVCRWVQRFTPELIEAARPGRPALAPGGSPARRT